MIQKKKIKNIFIIKTFSAFNLILSPIFIKKISILISSLLNCENIFFNRVALYALVRFPNLSQTFILPTIIIKNSLMYIPYWKRKFKMKLTKLNIIVIFVLLFFCYCYIIICYVFFFLLKFSLKHLLLIC